MATMLQKRLASEIAKNVKAKKPKNKRELLVSAGYDEVTATATPGRTIRQKGVQEELQVLGFTEENAKNVLSGILNSPTVYEMVTPENQIRAAQEVFKVFGTYKDESDVTKTITNNITQIVIHSSHEQDPRRVPDSEAGTSVESVAE